MPWIAEMAPVGLILMQADNVRPSWTFVDDNVEKKGSGKELAVPPAPEPNGAAVVLSGTVLPVPAESFQIKLLKYRAWPLL